MISTSEIYWITRATPIWDTVLLLMMVLGLLAAVLIYLAVEDYEDYNEYKREYKHQTSLGFVILLTLMLGISLVFIPKTSDLVAMKVLPAMLNNEDVQNIGPNAAKFIDVQLKQWIDKNLEGKT